MKILAIDSSSKSASACIYEDGKILSEFFVNNKLTHSTTLMPMVENCFKIAQLDFSAIDLIAVCNGPGSFTGLRIGVSTAKGLCAARNIPVIGISTLQAAAYNGILCDGIICAVMDARLSQVYNALFECRGALQNRLCEDRAISINDLKVQLEEFNDKNIYLTGDGAHLCYDELKDMANIELLPPQSIYVKASSLAQIAAVEFSQEQIENYKSALLKPVYLRVSQAERNLNNGVTV